MNCPHRRTRLFRLALVLAALALALAVAVAPTPALAAGTQPLYRCYDPRTGEHLYTTHMEEVDHLKNVGWNWEQDQSRTLPDSSGTPVWRVYNPATGDHHYTSDRHEYEVLTTQQGWRADFSGNPAFYSAGKDGMPFYRMRTNPYVTFGHLYSADSNEKDTLFDRGGWVDEGIGWYAVDTSRKPSNPTNPTNPTNSTNPTNPTYPSNPTNSTNPTNQGNPANPTNPTEPSNPTYPSNPTEFSDQAGPFADNAGLWEVWGTCEWRIADKTLYVRPKNAWNGEGTLGNRGDEGRWSAVYISDVLDLTPGAKEVTKVASSGKIHMAPNSEGLFEGFSSLSDVSGMANWDTLAETEMAGMFWGCTSLADLSPLANWDTSAVWSMDDMFYGCTSLKDLSPLANWDTAASMAGMFWDCRSLKDLSPLANWDTSGVRYMHGMFDGCTSLKDATVLENWDVSQVEWEFGGAFDDSLPREKRPSWAR